MSNLGLLFLTSTSILQLLLLWQHELMMSLEQTKSRIKAFLADHTTLTLATIAANGQPQAAPLFFAEMEDLSLVFISEQKVRHSQNIGAEHRVAAAVYADGQPWQSIRGIQLEGTCTALSGEDAQQARAAYLAKFTFIAESEFLTQMLDKATFYKILPAWVRLIDNSQGFGHKEEINFSSGVL